MSNSSNELRQEVVEEYLDQLCDQLTSLPDERQLELRQELRQHLGMLMAGWHGEAVAAGAALGRLVREFGDPTTIGRELARQWQATPTGTTFKPWEQGAALATFAWSVLFGTFLMHEMCRMFGWGGNLFNYALAGPFIPILLGLWWGRQHHMGMNMRWGYLGITVVNLLLSSLLPLPDFITRIELPPATTGQMVFWVHICHLILWLLLACSGCGVSMILRAWNAHLRHEGPTVA